MASVSGHQLDHQITGCLLLIGEYCLVLRCGIKLVVHVAVVRVVLRQGRIDHPTGYDPARIEHD